MYHWIHAMNNYIETCVNTVNIDYMSLIAYKNPRK